MELKEFIRHFAEQFDDTDSSEITAATRFHDLDEWSSLIAMSVISMVKHSYGKTLEGPEIKSCVTVEDLYKLIEAK
ncbi:MAG: acyl carrier protein [Succinivibrio sp.]|nr:acyl carrier protein [Succinivibrio sp.]